MKTSEKQINSSTMLVVSISIVIEEGILRILFVNKKGRLFNLEDLPF